MVGKQEVMPSAERCACDAAPFGTPEDVTFRFSIERLVFF